MKKKSAPSTRRGSIKKMSASSIRKGKMINARMITVFFLLVGNECRRIKKLDKIK